MIAQRVAILLSILVIIGVSSISLQVMAENLENSDVATNQTNRTATSVETRKDVKPSPDPTLKTMPETKTSEGSLPRHSDNQTNRTRIKASHRVDVIAPGEHVESIIDKLHNGRMALPTMEPPRSQNSSPHLRPPPQLRRPDDKAMLNRGPLESRRGGSNQIIPPPRGETPTTDRPRR